MPRYFFDTYDGKRHLRDEEGIEFPSAQEARDAAIRLLPDIARDALREGDGRQFVSTIRDQRGEPVFRATLSLETEGLICPPALDRTAPEQAVQRGSRVGSDEDKAVLAERPRDEAEGF